MLNENFYTCKTIFGRLSIKPFHLEILKFNKPYVARVKKLLIILIKMLPFTIRNIVTVQVATPRQSESKNR